MAQILPRDLTPIPGGTINPAAAIIVDNGDGVFQGTPANVVDAGAPVNTQGAAEAGVVNTGRMTPLRTAQAIAALGVSRAVLAAPGGAATVGFQPAGADAVARSIEDKLLGFVDVLDFIPVNLHAGIRAGTNTTDLTTYIQKAIDSLQTRGGTVYFPAGIYYTTATILARSGVSMVGTGRYYDYDGGNIFTGTWIRYRGTAPNPALSFFNIAHVNVLEMGIDCGEVASSVGLYLGSDNDPATKLLTFERMGFFGCAVAVQWGAASVFDPLEQVDDISFREISCNSCVKGFVVNAANAADFSVIERASFYSCSGVAFELVTPGFMRISECAAGSIDADFIMFDISGSSPDPVVIAGCQSEGVEGKFLRYTGVNDQSQIEMRGNVINQPVVLNGTLRVVTRNNFINSTITATGYVRWKSEDDVFDGLFGGASYSQQVFVDGSVQFSGYGLKNATAQRGFHLPSNFHIENGSATAGGFTGTVNTRAGIYAYPYAELASASFPVGFTVIPTADNAHAYVVTANVGAIGAEPAWPTGAGTTVTSGGVTFQEIGAAALMKGYGAIAA